MTGTSPDGSATHRLRVDSALALLEAVPGWSARARRWRREWEQLSQPVPPQLVWTGDAKAGRSTLINQLVGRPRLRTGVGRGTPVPVTMVRDGWRLQEVPPGCAARVVDGRVLVVDVRQPLPRRSPVVPDGGAPTVLLLTKLDRAQDDAVFADDVEAELREAIAEATRRARRRCEGPLAAVIPCDPRDAEAVREGVWPRVQAAMEPARQRAAVRREACREAWCGAVRAALSDDSAPRWPPSVPVAPSAERIAHATVTAALSSVALDREAWCITLRAVASHASLERFLEGMEHTLMAVLGGAIDQAHHASAGAWRAEVDALHARVDALWVQHTGSPVAPEDRACALPTVLPVERLQQTLRAAGPTITGAADGPLPGLARLRTLEQRKEAVRAAGEAVFRTLETDLGAELWGARQGWYESLGGAREARIARLEAAYTDILVDVERRRSEEQRILWEVRQRLAPAPTPPPEGARLRTL